MAKRKTNVEVDANAVPSERVHKAGGQAEVISHPWEINITPQWRPQITISTDVPKSLDEAKRYAHDKLFERVVAEYPTVRITPQLDWQQVNDNTWIATGNDGVQETTLPLVTITRVVS